MALKTCSFETAPKIMMVHFVRSVVDFRTFKSVKNKTIVPYKKKFNLKNYMSKAIDVQTGALPESAVVDYEYDLYAFIEHIGNSCTSGHYICYTKNMNHEGWNKCNDHKITPLKKDDEAFGK